MSKSKVYGIIWDVDGTLVDTAELHFEAWAATAQEMSKPFSRADFAATFGRRNPEIIHTLFGTDYSDQQVADLGDRKESLYRAAAQNGVALLPGVKALLEGLHAAGFKQAIGSSAPRANLELILRLTGVDSFFEAVVAMEDTQRGKPDPQVFLVGAAKLGIEPAHCLVLEDAPAGIQAAKAGGMKAIAVGSGRQHSASALRDAGADLVVETLEDVSVPVVRQILQEK